MRKTGLAVLAFIAFVLIASYAVAMDAGSVPRITANELKARLDKHEQIIIIDARTGGSYSTSPWKIKGDTRIAPDEVSTKAMNLPKGALIVTYCTWTEEATSARVALKLMRLGFKDVRALKGGFAAWVSAGYPLESK